MTQKSRPRAAFLLRDFRAAQRFMDFKRFKHGTGSHCARPAPRVNDLSA
jgi:hypothetical protein